jgi:putative flippase GtrA
MSAPGAMKLLRYTSPMDPSHPAAAETGRGWRWTERLLLTVPPCFRSKFFRYLVVGAVNTLFGYSVFAALILLHVPYPIAGLVSTVAGVLFNFKSYGALVFGSHDNRKIFRFVAVYALCYLIGLIPLAWAKAHDVSLLLVAAVMLLPMAGISFALNRALVYGARR